MSTLAVIMITKDEAHNLPRCLESVPFADEIVVVDTQSTDGTRDVARRYTEKVFDLPWQGFGMAKQAALDRASSEWVLSLDADEALDLPLAGAVENVVRSGDAGVHGYRVNRLVNFCGAWIRHSGLYPDRVLRLGRRSCMRFSPDTVHEHAEVTGRVRDLDGHLLHYTAPDLRSYLAKQQHYADLSAQALHLRGRRARMVDVALRPVYQLLRSYFLQRGFLDGVPGLLIAGGSALRVFTKYARLWELQRQAGALPAGPAPLAEKQEHAA
jgi:glycosyltransferase involved in cell wall biosynthesis